MERLWKYIAYFVSLVIKPFASKRGLIRALRLLFISVAEYSSDVRVHV